MQVAERAPEMMGPELKRLKLEGSRNEIEYGLFGAGADTATTSQIFTAEKEVGLMILNDTAVKEKVRKLAAENAVLVVGGRGCCMCLVVKLLLQGLGANPLVYEMQDDQGEVAGVDGGDSWSVQFPVVFIGGEMAGGMDWLMAAHISGELVPLLKKAGALWL